MRISTAGVAQQNGKVFLAKRKPGTSIGEVWEFPGGKAEAGETPPEALQREFKEELGVTVDVGRLLFEGAFRNRGTSYRLLAYAVRWEGEIAFLPEHQSTAWVSLAELDGYPLAPSDRLIAQALRQAGDHDNFK